MMWWASLDASQEMIAKTSNNTNFVWDKNLYLLDLSIVFWLVLLIVFIEYWWYWKYWLLLAG